jgi:spore coat protein CotH
MRSTIHRRAAGAGLALVVLLPLALIAQRGGFGPMQQERKVVAQFDKDGDKRLNTAERKAAREWLATQPAGGFGGRRGGFGGGAPAATVPGAKLTPGDVKAYPTAPVYDPTIIRTVFLEFEAPDWEQELAAFNNTDVDLPAKATIDGKVYPGVGVHFRGMSSFFMVPEGRKRSLNLSFDFTDEKQELGGYKTLNLLNAAGDPSFLRGVLYTQIASHYVPTPKMNYMRVAINGESWGLYLNAQQFNKDFTRDFFKSTKGARWKVPGSPGGRAGFNYLGENAADYAQFYQITSKDDPKAWAGLIKVFKVLNETPPDKLEAALAPLLDLDGALKFLAVEIALVNSDGFWARASDYSLYQDEKGILHILPHDLNEGMGAEEGGGRRGGPRGGFAGGPGPGGPGPGGPGPGGPGGPGPGGPNFGGPGGPGAGGFGGRGGFGQAGPELDPLVGLNDDSKPLRSKLLAVPALRARYLAYVHEIADKWLDWNTLGPIAKKYHDAIAADVKADTRKVYDDEGFVNGLASVKRFADARRAYLLKATSAAR